jgi:hypothetical protein
MHFLGPHPLHSQLVPLACLLVCFEKDNSPCIPPIPRRTNHCEVAKHRAPIVFRGRSSRLQPFTAAFMRHNVARVHHPKLQSKRIGSGLTCRYPRTQVCMNGNVEGLKLRLRVERDVIILQREGMVTKVGLKPIASRVAGVRSHLPAVQSDSLKDTLWGRGVSFGHPKDHSLSRSTRQEPEVISV